MVNAGGSRGLAHTDTDDIQTGTCIDTRMHGYARTIAHKQTHYLSGDEAADSFEKGKGMRDMCRNACLEYAPGELKVLHCSGLQRLGHVPIPQKGKDSIPRLLMLAAQTTR